MEAETFLSEHTQNQRPKKAHEDHDTTTIGTDDTITPSEQKRDEKPEAKLPINIKKRRREKRNVSEITEVIEQGLSRLPPEELRQFIKRLESVREKNIQETRNLPREEPESSREPFLKQKRKESDTRLERTYEIARMVEREKRLSETLKMPLEKITDLSEIDFIQLLDKLSLEEADDLSLWLYERHQLVGEKMDPLQKKDEVELSHEEKSALANVLRQRKNLGSKYMLAFNYLLERQKREQ